MSTERPGGLALRRRAGKPAYGRLPIELAWETFEPVGRRPQDLHGYPCGVFVSVAGSIDHGNRAAAGWHAIDPPSAMRNALGPAASRVSSLLDLCGSQDAGEREC